MQSSLSGQSQEVPLCVDLDGTLVNSDTLLESSLLLLKRNPLYVFAMLYWLLSGKANLKENIACRTTLDVSILPYNQKLLDFLQEQAEAHRTLILVSAANHRIANAIGDHLALFSEVLASSSTHNQSGTNKRDVLDERFGKENYDYVGNSSDDVPVWAHCRRAVVVNARGSVLAKAEKVARVERVFPLDTKALAQLLIAMRPRQWSKNLLIFVNILMAHQLTDTQMLASTAVAFIAFCLCSSAVYLINDLLDLDADRRHSEKHDRPFASGRLSLGAGILAAPLLLASSIVLAGYSGSTFLLSLIIYFVVTLAYSLYLKRIVILDVMVLAMLYSLRIVAGATVAGVMPSFWLMSFSLFIFTSLAMVKRYAELKSLELGPIDRASGRGYHVGDQTVLGNLGVASGYIAILVLALYINSPDVVELYRNEGLIWLLCPLLMYWIGRIWLLASRGEMHQDPVVFATGDRASYIVCALALIILWTAV